MNSNKLLIKLSKRFYTWILLSIILGSSGAIFNGLGFVLIIPVFFGLESVNFDDFPPIVSSIFQAFEGLPEPARAPAMIGCIVAAIILKNVIAYINAIVAGILVRRFSSSLRRDSFRLLLDTDLSYFADMRLGDLMNYVNNEVNRAASAVASVTTLVRTVFSILVYLGLLLYLSWQLTILATLLLGAAALVNQFSMKRAKGAGQEISRTAAALSRRAIEVLSGIRLVKAVAHENVEYETLKDLIAQREKAAYDSQVIFAGVSPINEIANIFAMIALVVIAQPIFANQVENFEQFMGGYLLILTRLQPFTGQLNNARNKLANTAPSVEIMEDFLRRDNKPIMTSGAHQIDDFQNTIRFRNVSFRYPNCDAWSLQNIDLVLPKGQTLALVGASGAGKSTLADLLARFYDPSQGSIEIDGVDLRECSLVDYRQKIGIVSQETFLFNTSVLENIRYGCPSATDEDVFRAAKQANALEFIQNLSDGFDTMIGDRGVMLSGGQRQRLAIARALLQGPEILILDEATSALDTVSERLVQQALEDLSKERTTLVIAHRLSTIQSADQIAAMEKGKVVEVGTHRELLQKGGYYANLHSIQFKANQATSELADEEVEAFKGDVGKMSYEVRSQLNGMLGLLGFLTEDMFEGAEEYEELTDRAYQSALNVLQSLENLEKKVLPTG